MSYKSLSIIDSLNIILHIWLYLIIHQKPNNQINQCTIPGLDPDFVNEKKFMSGCSPNLNIKYV